ncbi:TPA: Rrf2 family transcriptional regulator [Staphylococcus aureus]|nr:Rrf2 family transcriptional regulator [Staphylococcus aureus]
MNLEFNIAVHVLAFLTKHHSEKFNSSSLAELTCLNPVQLRRVTTQLVDLKMINTIRGKDGGYLSNDQSADVSLATLYKHFVLEKVHHTRLFTGDEGSHCQIARNITTTMSHYQQDEQNIIINFYNGKTIKDVIEDIQKEDLCHENI